jgi:hypothetical protein
MASKLFVSPRELVDLTGYKQKKLQCEWLVDHGWKHEVDRLGFPKVLRAELERRMLGAGTSKKERELDLKALAA